MLPGMLLSKASAVSVVLIIGINTDYMGQEKWGREPFGDAGADKPRYWTDCYVTAATFNTIGQRASSIYCDRYFMVIE